MLRNMLFISSLLLCFSATASEQPRHIDTTEISEQTQMSIDDEIRAQLQEVEDELTHLIAMSYDKELPRINSEDS